MPGYSKVGLPDLLTRPGSLSAVSAPDGYFYVYTRTGTPLALMFDRRSRTPVDVIKSDNLFRVFREIDNGQVALLVDARASVAEQRRLRRSWNEAMMTYERTKGVDRWRPSGWRGIALTDEGGR